VQTNKEGLTWDEWLAAATFGLRNSRRHTYSDKPAYDPKQLKKAWRAGECPCDWALELACRS
jgi:hypothetical protein